MRLYRIPSLLIFLAILTPLAAFSQTTYGLKSQKVTIDGTSSLHDWTSDVTKAEWTGKLAFDGATLKSVSDVTMKIEVAGIKSTKGDMMDEKTWEAFKYEQNPTITFKLTSATITGSNIKANGTLTMAGVTKPIVMNVTAKLLKDGTVRITGSQALNMKDYKMVPPKAVMGTIKVGEKVTVLYDLIVAPQ